MAGPPPSRCETCGLVHEAGLCRTLIPGTLADARPALPAPGQVDPMLGREVGGYELIAVLGSGSYGTVYRAAHRVVGKAVALKLLHAHLASDAEVVRRFVGEARATTLVHHQNVVQVLDINFIEGSRYYIVLELLEGETLEARCERPQPPPRSILAILERIEAARSGDHYKLLDVPESADIGTIRAAVARLAQWFAAARSSAGEAATARVEAAGRRLAEAEETMVTPRSRAIYDAERGNFVGVARAISNGLDPEELIGLSRQFVLWHPALAIPRPVPSVDPQRPDADETARKLATLLIEDPLNLELHRQYWAVRNRSRLGVAASLTRS